MSNTSIDPRHVVVIGAGPGLGAGIARRFGREGFAVTLVARSTATLLPLAEQLRAAGVVVDTVTADAARLGGFRRALEDLARRTAPGVVVYNVGLVAADDLLTSGDDYLADALAVDVLGAVTAAQVFTPAMRRAGSGTVLVTGGGPGLVPDPAHASLSLGKAALHAAVEVLHEQLVSDGVHVAAVVVVGVVAPGTALDPDVVAEAYWDLHTQPVGEWTSRTVVRAP